MFDLKNATINLPAALVERIVSLFERIVEIADHHFPTPRKRKKVEKLDDENFFVRDDEALWELEMAEENRHWRKGVDDFNPQADYEELLELRKGGLL